MWSAGEEAAPHLWRYVPGDAEPERIYVSPHADAVITDIGASERGYAFVETSRGAFGEGGWRVWFLGESGGVPIELDRGQAPGAGAAPTIAMDGDRIAWTAFDEPEAGPVSRLRIVSVEAIADVTTLIDQPIGDGLLWFPTLNGDELWYAILHPQASAAGDEFHLEWLSLSEPGTPTRFAGTGNDFNPAVSDTFVVWKTAEGDSAALNWGSLSVLDRRTNAVAAIPVPNSNRPSIGDRFVTFDEITHLRLAVYDPVANELFDLFDPDEQGIVNVGGQSLDGHLLAFFTQTDGFPQIGWAILPD